MRISSLNNIAFQKNLTATCSIGQTGSSKKAFIYELDRPEDRIILYKIFYDKKWQYNNYLNEITEEYEKPDKNSQEKYFIIEDKDKNILCISVLNTSNEKENVLEYIETAPTLSCYNRNSRPIKFIGETMIAFLAKLTKRERKDLFVLEIAPKPLTRNFYFIHCGFNPVPENNAIMPKEKLDTIIKMNERHTGSKIEILI